MVSIARLILGNISSVQAGIPDHNSQMHEKFNLSCHATIPAACSSGKNDITCAQYVGYNLLVVLSTISIRKRSK